MHLEGLIEQASCSLSSAENSHGNALRPAAGLTLLWQSAPSSFEASLYEPVLCLILQGRKQVTIGEHSVCGMVIGDDGGLSCMLTLTDDQCVACQAEQCTTTYNALVDASDVYTLGACVQQCESDCGTPYKCPDMCASAAPVSYGIFQTLRTCGITSCSQYCSATTVVL